MKAYTDFQHVYLYREPVDFRKSINGLLPYIEHAMQKSVFDHALFVFCNKSRDKLKVVYWDDTGFCLWYKRLEKDRFKWPKRVLGNALNISHEEFNWLLRGVDFQRIKLHQRLSFHGGCT